MSNSVEQSVQLSLGIWETENGTPYAVKWHHPNAIYPWAGGRWLGPSWGVVGEYRTWLDSGHEWEGQLPHQGAVLVRRIADLPAGANR